MRAPAIITAALVVILSDGTDWQVLAFAQDGTTAPAMSAADANELIRRRCVVCHNTTKPLGGLNFQLFDAAKPDPAVALMISIKVSQDSALGAAGNPIPDRATTDEFVRMMRVLSDQSASGPWTIDLQVDPRTKNRGHSWVIAQRRSGQGEIRLTCNGATRQFEVTPTQPRPDFQGLSPTIRAVFEWCLEGPSTTAEPAK